MLSDIGVHWNDDKPGLVVKTVVDGSGGAIAGLITGDEILAIGEERLRRENLEKLMTSFRPGEQVSLLVSRRGKVINLDITLDVAIPDRFEIMLKSGFGKRDISRLKRLLGQDLNK